MPKYLPASPRYTAELGLEDETNQRAVAFLGVLASDPTAQDRPGLAGELLKRTDDDPQAERQAI